MKIIKKRNYLISVFLTSFVFLAIASFVFAAIEVDKGNLPDTTIKKIIIEGINWLVAIVATVSVIIVLVAGALWVTSGGNEERVKSARRFLVGGLAGVAIALGAWAIVRVVLSLFPGGPSA